MGYLIKFFLVFFAVYLLVRAFSNWLFGKRPQSHFSHDRKQPSKQPSKQPETQEERMIEYQKKKFESTEVEDADFEEVKNADQQ